MSEKILKNLQWNLLITTLIGIMGFIVNKYFVKYMGTETLGLMKLFTQMIAYLNLVELGVGSAATYALYKPLAEKDFNKLNSVVSTINFFYKKISQIVLGIGILLSLTIPYFIKSDTYGTNIYVYWILYVINTSIGYLFAKYIILFTANQEYGYVRKVEGFGKILFQIIQIVCLIKIQSFSIFIIIMILQNLYNFYFFANHYKKKYSYIKKVQEKEKDIIKDMKNLFWHKIGGLVVHNTDYIILSKFISLSIVGIYSSYLMIYQIITILINIITPTITPKVGNFITKNSKENIYIYWKELQTLYIFLSTILILCTFYLIEPFMLLWLGNFFILPKFTVILILINLFINLSKVVIDMFKFACGFFDDVYSPILESVINLFVSLILVQKVGLNGVIVGTLCSNIIVISILKPILVFKKCFSKNIFIFIKDTLNLLMPVVLSIIGIKTITLLIKFDTNKITTWINFIEQAIILCGLSIVVISIAFMINKDFRVLINKILKYEKKL